MMKHQMQCFAFIVAKQNRKVNYEAQLALQDIIIYFKELSPSEHHIYSEILTILNLILVNPSTNS